MRKETTDSVWQTIAIVSRSHLICLGVEAFVSQHQHLRFVGQAGSRREAEALVARTRPDIVLLELDGTSEAVECARAMRALLPTIRIILLCGVRNRDYPLPPDGPMIDDVVLTTQPLTALRAAVDTLLSPYRPKVWGDHAERNVPRESGTSTNRSGRPGLATGSALLTKRESDVLALLGEGLTNKDIARRLFICPTTVRHHLSHMFNKLDVSSRQQLLLRAQQEGFLHLNSRGYDVLL